MYFLLYSPSIDKGRTEVIGQRIDYFIQVLGRGNRLFFMSIGKRSPITFYEYWEGGIGYFLRVLGRGNRLLSKSIRKGSPTVGGEVRFFRDGKTEFPVNNRCPSVIVQTGHLPDDHRTIDTQSKLTRLNRLICK